MLVFLSALAISASMQGPQAANPTPDHMTLVFRQWCSPNSDDLQTYGILGFEESRSPQSPGNNEYSILPQLENMKYRNVDGTEVYRFRLEYNGRGLNAHWFEWTQTNNPVTHAEPGTVANIRIYDGADNLATSFPNFNGLHRDGINALLVGRGCGGPNFEIGSFQHIPDSGWSVKYPHYRHRNTCSGLSLYAITNQARHQNQQLQDTTLSVQDMRAFVINQFESELQVLQQQQREIEQRLERSYEIIADLREEREETLTRVLRMRAVPSHQVESSVNESIRSMTFPRALKNNFTGLLEAFDVTKFKEAMDATFASEDHEARQELAELLLDNNINNYRWTQANKKLAREQSTVEREESTLANITSLIASIESKRNAFTTRYQST